MKLGDKVYCYYDVHYPLLEGNIIQITSNIDGTFYLGKAYRIDSSPFITIPEERVFVKHSEWEEYYNSICKVK